MPLQIDMKGFSLIETIIYIALLGLLLTTAVLTSYQILQGSTNVSNKTIVQDEGDFVVRKLDWALSSASAASAPTPSTLTVTRYDGNTIDFRLNGMTIEMRESAVGVVYKPITTVNVRVQSLQFQVTGSTQIIVTAAAYLKTANGAAAALPFTIAKALRK